MCRECKASGDKHVESRKERFEKIKRQQRAAGEISDKADRHARLRALSKTRADLLMPIAKIFKDQLKRRHSLALGVLIQGRLRLQR